MSVEIVLRTEKGSPLTMAELDGNFSGVRDLSVAVEGMIPDDAPADGFIHGRQDGEWVPVPAASGGGGGGLSIVAYQPFNAYPQHQIVSVPLWRNNANQMHLYIAMLAAPSVSSGGARPATQTYVSGQKADDTEDASGVWRRLTALS